MDMNQAIQRYYRHAGEFTRGLVYRMVLQGDVKWFQREPGLVELVVLDPGENLTDESYVDIKYGTQNDDVAILVSKKFEDMVAGR